MKTTKAQTERAIEVLTLLIDSNTELLKLVARQTKLKPLQFPIEELHCRARDIVALKAARQVLRERLHGEQVREDMRRLRQEYTDQATRTISASITEGLNLTEKPK